MQPWKTCLEINAVELRIHFSLFLHFAASSHCMISFGAWKVKQKGISKKQSGFVI